MTDFTLGHVHDGTYCPLSSFRILSDTQAALSHLHAVAHVLRPGGPYILDMAFEDRIAPDLESPSEEWTMRRGNVEVRAESGRIYVQDGDRGIRMVLDWGENLRRYRSATFIELVRQSGVFAVEAWYPQTRKTKDGISIFDIQQWEQPPLIGRTMVALKRLPAEG